jgi:cardiolipin synthase A/B
MYEMRVDKSIQITDGNKVRLIRSGSEYFELLTQIIDSSIHILHLQVYIFDGDDTGESVMRAVVAAARRGVKIYVLLDGYASQSFPATWIHDMRNAGVTFKWFSPLLKSRHFYFGRRLHQKVVVADGHKALVGGINISDRYNDTITAAAWLDWALYVEGQVSAHLQKICEGRMNESLPDQSKNVVPPISLSGLMSENCQVSIWQNDWLQRQKEITSGYLQLLRQAKSHVIIMSPYFLPGIRFIRAIKRASARGVKIQLILSGISDVHIAKHAERYMYRWLFKKNIELYEYRKRVLHGKVAVFDEENVTVGSYNINNLSAYASIELNLAVTNRALAIQVKQNLTDILNHDCIRITALEYTTKRQWIDELVQRGSYYTLRILFFLFTFYYKQRE